MEHTRLQEALAPLLRPFSLLYALAMRLRAAGYARGFPPSRRPAAFCVSVGNIAWGGSGKTPVTAWLLRQALEWGARPAVISRGYGGRTKERPLPVLPLTSPEASGDEPLMLARAFPQVPVLADPSRLRALAWLEARRATDFLVLDDAMQHLSIRRDLNLVLLRAQDLDREWDRVIPLGSWREGKEALARADAFLLRLKPDEALARARELEKRLGAYGKPIFSFALYPLGLSPLVRPAREAGAAVEPLPPGSPYALCTAVGNPDSVRRSAEELLGRAPALEFLFADHHPFRPADLRKAARAGLPLLVTTKDAVKLLRLPELPPRIFVLESEARFGPAFHTDKTFAQWLEQNRRACATRAQAAPPGLGGA